MRREGVARVLICAMSMFVLIMPLGSGSTIVDAKDPGSIYGTGPWRNQTFYKFQTDTIGGDMTALVDSHMGIHIFFVESMGRNLMYARNQTGLDWSISTIESEVFTVWPRGMLAFFAFGEIPVVVYGDNSSSLRYAQKIGSNWVANSVPGVVGGAVAAKQSLNGGFSILYSHDETLYLAEGTGDQWNITSIMSLPNAGTVSADFGLNHSVHVSYSNSSSHQLLYATNRTGNWTSEVLDGNCVVTRGLKLLVDPDGDARVAYCDEFNNNIKYASSDNGNWTILPTFGAPLFERIWDVDMALGKEGHAMLCFRTSDGYYYVPASTGVMMGEVLIGTGSEDGGSGATGPPTITAQGSSSYVLYISFSEKDDSLCYKIASNAQDFVGEEQEVSNSTNTTLVGVAVALALVVVVVLVLVLRFRRKT